MNKRIVAGKQAFKSGDRVVFTANAAAMMLYKDAPASGSTGVVEGEVGDPARKFIWVNWDNGSRSSVYKRDLEKAGKQAGGGAGISFKDFEFAVSGFHGSVRAGGEIAFDTDNDRPSLESFSCLGYDDGMDGVRGSLLKISNVYLTDVDGVIAEAKQVAEAKGITGEVTVSGSLSPTSYSKYMIFGGYVRGDIKGIKSIEADFTAHVDYYVGDEYILSDGGSSATVVFELTDDFYMFYADVFNPDIEGFKEGYDEPIDDETAWEHYYDMARDDWGVRKSNKTAVDVEAELRRILKLDELGKALDNRPIPIVNPKDFSYYKKFYYVNLSEGSNTGAFHPGVFIFDTNEQEALENAAAWYADNYASVFLEQADVEEAEREGFIDDYILTDSGYVPGWAAVLKEFPISKEQQTELGKLDEGDDTMTKPGKRIVAIAKKSDNLDDEFSALQKKLDKLKAEGKYNTQEYKDLLNEMSLKGKEVLNKHKIVFHGPGGKVTKAKVKQADEPQEAQIVQWTEEFVTEELVKEFGEEHREEIIAWLDLEDGPYSSFGTCGKFEVESVEYTLIKDDDEAEKIAVATVEEDLSNEPSLFSQDWLVNHVYMTPTDIRVYANDLADSNTSDMRDEDALKECERQGIVIPGGSELEDLESELENETEAHRIEELETAIENARETVLSNAADELRDSMVEEIAAQLKKDPVGYFLDNGFYSTANELLENHVVSIDITAAAQDAVDTDGWEHFLSRYDGDYTTTEHGMVYFREN